MAHVAAACLAKMIPIKLTLFTDTLLTKKNERIRKTKTCGHTPKQKTKQKETKTTTKQNTKHKSLHYKQNTAYIITGISVFTLISHCCHWFIKTLKKDGKVFLTEIILCV